VSNLRPVIHHLKWLIFSLDFSSENGKINRLMPSKNSQSLTPKKHLKWWFFRGKIMLKKPPISMPAVNRVAIAQEFIAVFFRPSALLAIHAKLSG
jgi:hypothetical protein